MCHWHEKAYAKVNLTLDVLGKRPDGYHDLHMLMQTVSLCDEITLAKTDDDTIRVTSNLSFLPSGKKNLAGLAAFVFLESLGLPTRGLCLNIRKEIPVCAGLGGGSADAAAVLRLLNRVYKTGLTATQLEEMAAQIGSDVPFCIRGGTQIAEGRGEKLTALPSLPPCHIVLCKPPYSVSTGAVFALWHNGSAQHPDHSGVMDALSAHDLRGLSRRMYNVLEDILPVAQTDLRHIRNILTDTGALGVVMSGSGPTVLGLFDDAASAQTAGKILRAQYLDTFVTTVTEALML